MTVAEFNNLDVKTKSYVLQEMCRLYDIVSNYPTTVDDLETFAKWQYGIGRFGEDLERFLFLQKY